MYFYMYPLSFKYFGVFFSLYFIAQWHSWATLYQISASFLHIFVKFLPIFLLLPLSSVAWFLFFYVISHDTLSPSMGRQLSTCFQCVSLNGGAETLQAAFSSCVNTAGKLRVDRGSRELFSFSLCVLECCSENHGFRLSLHNGTFHVHV